MNKKQTNIKGTMKKYNISASQSQCAEYSIEVSANSKEEAEKIALQTDINKWSDYDVWNQDELSVDSCEEI